MNQSKVLVAGTGISGIAAARLVLERGGEVVLYDGNTALDPAEIRKKFKEEDKVGIVLGEIKRSDLLGVELCIISPGIPLNSAFVSVVDEAGIPVLGEIELAYQCGLGKLAAITGTNGKTTTTALVGEIVKAYEAQTFVVGNIGNPYTKEVLRTSEKSYTVAEISSFQLESVHKFHPVVSAILNITPDHLNRHHTMECYAHTKEMISYNQNRKDVCVLNYDDEILREFGKQCSAEVVWFGRINKPDIGAFMDGEMIKYTDGMTQTDILNVKDMNLIGTHNYENVMAAICITKALGIPDETIVSVIKGFKAVEHRIEYVATKNGVMYYNDSKGTNPEAAVKAIEAMSRPTILIGGGYDKGSEFDLYVKAFKGRVKKLVLLGQTSDKIADTAAKYGFTDIIKADSLKEVVDICAKEAQPGDAVLLSPACASWGMFDNYEQRGRMFKEYVNAL